jgi:anthranilate phosphoribosyltransferase
LLEAVLANEPGPCRDIVTLNAGVALYAAGVADTPQEGVARAREAIETGRAQAVAQSFIACTQALASEAT